MALATAAGPTDIPLINQTIGENLEATAARFGDREALVVPHQGLRYTYADFNDAAAVDILDLDTLGTNWGGAPIPEPATRVVMAMGGSVLLRRRR